MKTTRPGRGSALCAALLVGATLLACKKKAPEPAPAPAPSATVSPDLESAKKLQPDIKKLMGRVSDMAAKARKEPKVRADRPFKTKLEDGKYIIVGDKWLDDPHRKAGDDELDLGVTVLSLCAYAAKDDELEANDLKYMQECLGWDYMAVVRQRSLTPPKVKLDSDSFDAGSFVGDLLLFDLDTGNIVGRYQMNITNSDKLTYQEGKPEAEWQELAKRDLLENVTGVIGERLRLERDSMGR